MIVFICCGAIQLLVGPGVLLVDRADEGAILDPRDI